MTVFGWFCFYNLESSRIFFILVRKGLAKRRSVL